MSDPMAALQVELFDPRSTFDAWFAFRAVTRELVHEYLGDWPMVAYAWFLGVLRDNATEFLYALGVVVWSIVRATGKTVETGTHGLKFSFGRATRVVEPGFHLLVPFLQVVRTVPTRSRTLDLPPQQVTTFEGLVYRVEANLVYRVEDVKLALVQIDNLVKGMLEMLGLGVQDVVRAAERASLRVPASLDGELEQNLAARLRPWGVVVESAGFTSITPTRETLRITQIDLVTRERRKNVERLVECGLPPRLALALLGTNKRVLSRTRHLRELQARLARRKRINKALMSVGFTREQIRRAEFKLRPGELSAEREREREAAEAE